MKKEIGLLTIKGWIIVASLILALTILQLSVGYATGFYPKYSHMSFFIGFPIGIISFFVALKTEGSK